MQIRLSKIIELIKDCKPFIIDLKIAFQKKRKRKSFTKWPFLVSNFVVALARKMDIKSMWEHIRVDWVVWISSTLHNVECFSNVLAKSLLLIAKFSTIPHLVGKQNANFFEEPRFGFDLFWAAKCNMAIELVLG